MTQFDETQFDQNNNQANNELEAISVQLNSQNQIPFRTDSAFKYRFYHNVRRCLWIYPLFVTILLPLFCFGAYIYAVSTKQMKPILPYISDTIGVAPQAGIASGFFDVVTILMLITGFIRYKQLKYYIGHRVKLTLSNNCSGQEQLQANLSQTLERLNSYNFLSMLSLVMAALGLFLIANCRVTENNNLHFMGLIMFITGISCYFSLMIYVTKHLSTNYQVESKPITMSIACAIAVLCLVSLLILTCVSSWQAGAHNFIDNQWRFNWTEDKPGYWSHVICTVMEWIGIVACGMLLYACIFRRFKNFHEWNKVRFGQ